MDWTHNIKRMEKNMGNEMIDNYGKVPGGCADATGYTEPAKGYYPQEGTAPDAEPIDYRAKLKAAADAARAYNTKPLPYKYPNGGALTKDKQAPKGGVGPRQFATGATRNSDDGKPDYEGFISPLVVKRFGQYMHKHRHMEDGSLRDSDNWQKGIPRKQYLKSMLRHVMDVWLIMRGKAVHAVEESLEEALCAVKFNVDGLLHEVLIGRGILEVLAANAASNPNSLAGVGLGGTLLTGSCGVAGAAQAAPNFGGTGAAW